MPQKSVAAMLQKAVRGFLRSSPKIKQRKIAARKGKTKKDRYKKRRFLRSSPKINKERSLQEQGIL